MRLLGGLIPDWVWVVGLVIIAVSFFVKGRAHRRTLVTAAAAPDAGRAEQDALRNWTLGGVGMAALLVGTIAPFVLPRSFALVTLPAGAAICWACVLLMRRSNKG